MKRSTFAVSFYIKRNRLMKSGEAPIYTRITTNGQRAEFGLKRSILPEDWDTSRGRSSKRNRDAIALNEYINEVWGRIQDVRKQLEHEGSEATSQEIMDRYLGKDTKRKNLLELYQEHNDKLKERIDKGVAYGTWERHRTSRAHFESFLLHKLKKTDILYSQITKSILDDYYHFLITVESCANNTAFKYLMNLSKVLNLAAERGYLRQNPYPQLKLRKDDVETDFLTEEELEKVMTKEFATNRLSEVRDAFVFSCLTGLAFIDIKTLKKEHVEIHQGEEWILKPRKKSKVISRIPVLPGAMKILDRYKAYADKTGFLLPVKTNQKMNEYLKEIGTLSGLSKNLTTHMARHTFATTVTLSNNVSIESVSKMLGHANLAMTQKYARILDKKINGEMAAVACKY
jgi:site-specific recombinase XerD